jgi:hypothetical protein
MGKYSRVTHRCCRVVTLASLIAWVVCTQANATTAGANPTAAHPELYAFDTFLDGHNDIAAALVSVPALAKSDSFLGHHPELAQLFQKYPGLQEELLQRPDVLRNREQRFHAASASGVQITRASVDWLDKYLASNPSLEQTLRARPGAIDDAQVLAEYDALKKELDEYPALAQAFKGRPAVFLARPDFFAHRPGERKAP